MKNGNSPDGLKLTEDEAYALLGLCLTSPTKLDATSEKALRKLAGYCKKQSNHSDPIVSRSTDEPILSRELSRFGV